VHTKPRMISIGFTRGKTPEDGGRGRKRNQASGCWTEINIRGKGFLTYDRGDSTQKCRPIASAKDLFGTKTAQKNSIGSQLDVEHR